MAELQPSTSAGFLNSIIVSTTGFVSMADSVCRCLLLSQGIHTSVVPGGHAPADVVSPVALAAPVALVAVALVVVAPVVPSGVPGAALTVAAAAAAEHSCNMHYMHPVELVVQQQQLLNLLLKTLAVQHRGVRRVPLRLHVFALQLVEIVQISHADGESMLGLQS